MKKTGVSSASGVIRGLFLLLLVLRVARSCLFSLPAQYACCSTWTDPLILWIGARTLADLVFLYLVWTRFDRIWVPPLTFLWLPIPTILSTAGLAASPSALLGIGLVFSLFLVGGLAVGRLFEWSGIRGRILIVCLASAGLPMFYLVLALGQQSWMIIDKAFFPMARILIETDLKRLNAALVARLNEDVEGLLGYSPKEPAPPEFAIGEEAVYVSRAASLGIPLESAYEISPTWGAGEPAEPTEEEALQEFLEKLGETPDVFCELRTQTNGQKVITIQAPRPVLEKILRNARPDPKLSTILAPGNIIIQAGHESPLATLHLSLTENGLLTNPQFQEFADHFPDPSRPKVFVYITYDDDLHTLTLGLPQRTGGKIGKGMLLRIDLRKWVAKVMKQELNSGGFQIRCCFPSTRKQVTQEFTGYQIEGPDGVLRPFTTEALGLPFDGAFAGHETPTLGVEPVFSPNLLPHTLDHPGMRNLKIHSPTLADYVLESWGLPFCRAPVLVMINTDYVWISLFHSQILLGLFCFLAVLVAGFMSLVYSDRLSRPIREITGAAQEIAEGKSGDRIPGQAGEAEIEELARSLDLMARKLTGRIAVVNQQLVSEKDRFETLLESTWEGIFLLDGQGCMVYANQAGRQLLGIGNVKEDFAALLGRVGTEFQPPLTDSWKKGIAEFKGQFLLPCGSNGNHKVLALYIRACRGSATRDGETLETVFIAVLRDITVEKEIDRMKSDFVSQVSHELRTPLTSIKAYTEMLLDGEGDDAATRRDYLRITFDEAERLTRLINDLLDIARIESGRRPLKLTEIDLGTLTRGIAEIMKAQLEKNQQVLQLHLPDRPLPLLGDADLLKQAGLNLLSNASKYTRPGGTIDLTAEERLDGQLVWKFSDNGVGLSPKEKEKLFEKFFRADSDFVRSVGGTGLGLTLVKHIVDLHQGEIIVDSVLDKGTTFTLTIPSGRTT